MSRSQADNDNHANQMNPNHGEYWGSRGWEDRPDDWDDRAEDGDTQPDADAGQGESAGAK